MRIGEERKADTVRNALGVKENREVKEDVFGALCTIKLGEGGGAERRNQHGRMPTIRCILEEPKCGKRACVSSLFYCAFHSNVGTVHLLLGFAIIYTTCVCLSSAAEVTCVIVASAPSTATTCANLKHAHPHAKK